MKKKKFRTTIIDGVVYVMRDDVFFPVNEKKSSRLNSWITLDQITKEFPEFYDKIEDIFSKKYNERAKSFYFYYFSVECNGKNTPRYTEK